MREAKQKPVELPADLLRICEARHHDPFAQLGRHAINAEQSCIRVFAPHTRTLLLEATQEQFNRIGTTDLFEWRGATKSVTDYYRLVRIDSSGLRETFYDPYSFAASISDLDLYLFGEGRHWQIYSILGAHLLSIADIAGVRFATWAPNAERVSVIGDFNRWDGRCHPMRNRGSSGVWEIFIPGLKPGQLYKFEIRHRDSGSVQQKTDPYAQEFELRPHTASRITQSQYHWQDQDWMQRRSSSNWLHTPMSIYEVHLGSWQRDNNGRFFNYRELARRLAAHVRDLGFTHIELLPITEHPLDDSWGYQTTGYFAPTQRFGSPDDFRYFVDYFHQQGIGVFIDWVPAHFPRDDFALARFDGSNLYEHEDPRRSEHPDWGTLIFNYARNEVRNFLISSAVYWLKEFHIDGMRVDAVASMLYLDYSRKDGAWLPNIHGGNENIDAIAFLRELNRVTHRDFPGSVIMAEESTAWPMVTRPTDIGGLGFSMKWNMGWMHDTLSYFSKDPIHRRYHHDQLTFGLLYLFHENFILPMSHDEIVHGKASLLYKMPGDEWQRFANLRLLYTYMFTYPGKKLLFMGCEFGQGSEWNFATVLDWYVLEYPYHQGIRQLVRDLNRLYVNSAALSRHEFEPSGFEWIDCHDAAQSVLVYLRRSEDAVMVVAMNYTPVPREKYRIGVPHAGRYHERLNSDSHFYAGSNIGNSGDLYAESIPWMGRPYSIALTLPPLAGIVLEWSGTNA
ncbi:MAG: 1,4-alpha-glucan branching protein GlgB [Gammaproteobacteria bacterium]|nr:1,4-alpha-glucan branching protein GlgB [Gammaproteobacteria bacterium]